MNPREDIAFLVGSRSRVEIFESLDDSPSRPTELSSTCNCARETAQRTLAGFVERGWVEKRDGCYRLTPGGRYVLECYERLATVVRRAERVCEFLTNGGEPVADLPVETMGDVTVTTTATDDPHAVIDRYLTVLGTEPVDSFRGFTPIVSRVFNEAAAGVIGPETEMELVIDESVLTLSEMEYPDALQRADDLNQFTLCLTSKSIEFGLVLVDGHVLVGAYDDHQNLVASIDGRDEELRSWAEEKYAQYRRDAVVLDRPMA